MSSGLISLPAISNLLSAALSSATDMRPCPLAVDFALVPGAVTDGNPTYLVVVVNASVFQMQASSSVDDNAPFKIMVVRQLKSRKIISTALKIQVGTKRIFDEISG